jgi:hypothetical protein
LTIVSVWLIKIQITKPVLWIRIHGTGSGSSISRESVFGSGHRSRVLNHLMNQNSDFLKLDPDPDPVFQVNWIRIQGLMIKNFKKFS